MKGRLEAVHLESPTGEGGMISLESITEGIDDWLVIVKATIRNDRVVMDKARRICKFDQGFYVDLKGLSGGLALWWKDDVEVSVTRSFKEGIETRVKFGYNGGCRVTWIYGCPEFEDRRIQ
ncbi:hypothetical protein PTKIN_Ptkin11bG0158800 [Pterospermum kingtungense]